MTKIMKLECESNDSKYKIGYIDEDINFANTFKLRLKEFFDITLIPVTSKTSLNSILKIVEKSNLDCLIVDFNLKETEIVTFFGDEIIEKLRLKNPYFPTFILTSKEEELVLSEVEDNEIVRLKDELSDKKNILVTRIQNKIVRYYNMINSAETELKNLVVKKQNQKITLLEEERISEIYSFLDKIYYAEKIFPSHLAKKDNLTRLEEFVESSKDILAELIKSNK
jgi:hypothetical protein